MKSVLFVYSRGGAPLEHVLPQIAACGAVHMVAITTLPDSTRPQWFPSCASVTDLAPAGLRGESLVDVLVEHAKAVAADAIMCVSEYAVVAVSEAALRLGLPGPGAHVRRSRDKELMRRTWLEAGVPIPDFRSVNSQSEIVRALHELRPPLLLKSAYGAGSVGQVILREPDDVPLAWTTNTRAVTEDSREGFTELFDVDSRSRILVEEIIEGSIAGWYPEGGYADYLSVEGIVAEGVYHPLCITARIPTIPPFTELSNNAPCVLSEPLQRRIEAVARAAVDALHLDTCGTHTEIKLAADGELYVIESAARFGGCMVTKEIETVFGWEPIGALCRQLLGEPVDYPDRMWTRGQGAAASLALIATDSQGVPWSAPRIWRPEMVDWSRLLSPGSRIDIVDGLTIPAGSTIRPYDPAAGAGNWAGIFFLTARDPGRLLADCRAVLDGIEDHLEPAGGGVA